MPKKPLAITILTAILVLVISVQAVEVEANPTVPYPQVPNTDLPSLTVETPANPTPLSDNNTAALYITVIQPDAWLRYYMGLKPLVGAYYGLVNVDGVMKINGIPSHGKVNTFDISFTGYPDTVLRFCGFNRSFTGEAGQHKLTIQLVCKTFSQIGDYQSNVTQDVSFTIDSSSQSISFLATPVRVDRGTYPSISPTNSPSTFFLISTQGTVSIVVYVIVILAVASSLVYFRRKRRSWQVSQP